MKGHLGDDRAGRVWVGHRAAGRNCEAPKGLGVGMADDAALASPTLRRTKKPGQGLPAGLGLAELCGAC